MSRAIETYQTKSGELTLYIPELDETYHSRDGAISETDHVFIQEGLAYFLKRNQTETCRIFELGMGTGLNVLRTALYAGEHNLMIEYHSVEAYPLEQQVWSKLNYCGMDESYCKDLFQRIHTADWNKKVELSENFIFYKYHRTFEELDLREWFDVVYFDAFGPKKQAELWDKSIFQKLKSQMTKGAVLTTYSAAGHLKRNLKELGFLVEQPPGANGKRAMTRAVLS